MNPNLKELSIEQLELEVKNRKKFRNVMIGFIILMLVGSLITIILSSFSPAAILPVAFTPLLLIFQANYSNAKKELDARTK